jgi:hypothetical protein
MKKLRISFVVVILLVLVSGIVYASASALKLSYSKKGKPGSTVSLSLSLQNTNTFDSAITSIEGYLNFDSEVFEDVTINSFESNNGKVQIGNKNNLDLIDLSGYSSSNQSQVNGDAGFYFNGNPLSNNDNKIVLDFATPISEDAKLFTINLKVKSNASVKEYQKAIEIANFKLFFEDNSVTSIDSLVLPFTVEAASGSNEVNNSTNNAINNITNNAINNTSNNVINNVVNNNIVNNTVNNVVDDDDDNTVNNSVDNRTNNAVDNKSDSNSNKSNSNNDNSSKGGKTDPTTSDKNLPYTGFKTIVVPFVLLLTFSYVIYKKYKKNKID